MLWLWHKFRLSRIEWPGPGEWCLVSVRIRAQQKTPYDSADISPMHLSTCWTEKLRRHREHIEWERTESKRRFELPKMCRNSGRMWRDAFRALMGRAAWPDSVLSWWFACNLGAGTRFVEMNSYKWADNCMDIAHTSCPAERYGLAGMDEENVQR